MGDHDAVCDHCDPYPDGEGWKLALLEWVVPLRWLAAMCVGCCVHRCQWGQGSVTTVPWDIALRDCCEDVHASVLLGGQPGHPDSRWLVCWIADDHLCCLLCLQRR